MFLVYIQAEKQNENVFGKKLIFSALNFTGISQMSPYFPKGQIKCKKYMNR